MSDELPPPIVVEPLDLGLILETALAVKKRCDMLQRHLAASNPKRQDIIAACIALRHTWKLYEHTLPT